MMKAHCDWASWDHGAGIAIVLGGALEGNVMFHSWNCGPLVKARFARTLTALIRFPTLSMLSVGVIQPREISSKQLFALSRSPIRAADAFLTLIWASGFVLASFYWHPSAQQSASAVITKQ